MNSIRLYDYIYSPGLFISLHFHVMIAAYVDDCIMAAISDKLLDKYLSKKKENFLLKEIGVMKNNFLDTDILGIDLIYKRNEGIVQSNMKNYIEKLANEYKYIIDRTNTKITVPYLSKYDIDPSKDDLTTNKSELKKKIKYLQELMGKLHDSYYIHMKK